MNADGTISPADNPSAVLGWAPSPSARATNESANRFHARAASQPRVTYLRYHATIAAAPPPTPKPPHAPALLTVTESTPADACKVTDGGACISCLNHGNNERCTFGTEGAVSDSATTFETEASYDYITIGGTRILAERAE